MTDELGRLSRWLRILGYDTVIESDKKELVLKSLRDDRIILTRDSKMSRFSGMRVVKIASDFVEEQLAQVIKELGLEVNKEDLFSICIICDEKLAPLEKEKVKGRVPKNVYDAQDLFMECRKCGRVYWRGSHWDMVQKFLDKMGA